MLHLYYGYGLDAAQEEDDHDETSTFGSAGQPITINTGKRRSMEKCNRQSNERRDNNQYGCSTVHSWLWRGGDRSSEDAYRVPKSSGVIDGYSGGGVINSVIDMDINSVLAYQHGQYTI